jgi:uncharacterized membrane protein (UPF0127 family)
MSVLLALLLLMAVACGGDTGAEVATEPPALHPSVDGYPAAVLEITGTDGASATVAVRVADTVERRSHGLMEVPDLPDGTGMWFVYDADHQSAFWMRNTLVPLDIAFVTAAGQVAQILTMEPCEADPCRQYPPGVTYRNALEVPEGWFQRVGIGVGATVRQR